MREKYINCSENGFVGRTESILHMKHLIDMRRLPFPITLYIVHYLHACIVFDYILYVVNSIFIVSDVQSLSLKTNLTNYKRANRNHLPIFCNNRQLSTQNRNIFIGVKIK